MAELTSAQQAALAAARERLAAKEASPTTVGADAEDGFIDNTLDVLGEAAAGANRTLMWIPDTVAKAINYIPGVDIPTLSEAVGSVTGYKPGDGGYMEPGTARDAVSAAGEVLVPGAMALTPVQGRNLASTPQAAAEFLGFGSRKAPVVPGADAATREAVERGSDMNLPAPRKLPPGAETSATPRAQRNLAVRGRTGDVAAAGYKADEFGNVVKDKAQRQAIKAGLEPRVVAQVAAGTKKDKSVMAQMLDILEQGRQNKTYGDFNPPRIALGDTLFDRYEVLRRTNREFGRKVGEETKRLRQIPLDAEALNNGPIRAFAESLDELGVKLGRDGTINFRGSRFEGSPGAQRVLRNLFKRMYDTDAATAYDAHRLKEFIDDMVDEYGKSTRGLSGKAERVVKELRHNVNAFLRDASPEYANANDVYSETIEALDNIQKMVGRNNMPTRESLARAARSALSNAQKSESTKQMLLDLEDMANRYGAELGDDLKTQASFVQTLEKMFPTAKPPASFGGEIDKSLDAINSAVNATRGDSASLVGLSINAAKKMFGKGEAQSREALIKALREMIES